MSNDSAPIQDGTNPPTPGTKRGHDLHEVLAARFRPFLSLFGSTAAVSAFLLFAGFLSDFGAYRMAGLPRLSFSLTALLETGSDVAVDMLSLLAQGTRAFWLALIIGTVIALWSASHNDKLRPYARSRRLYRITRLLLFGFCFIVFSSLVDRTQRSLSGEMHTAAAVERALQEAYDGKFPDPYERQRAIDRQGYELRFYRLPNFATKIEGGWQSMKSRLIGADVDSERLDDASVGLVLRRLPETRRDARHVFGWLALTVLFLVLAAVLCQWWHESVARYPGEPESGHTAALKWLDGNMDAAIERLVMPLTILLLAISILLLPLAHGVLAKKALGGEHVMVYLKDPKSPATEEIESGKKGKDEASTRLRPFLHPEPTQMAWPAGRFDCAGKVAGSLDELISEYNNALLKLTQKRKSISDEFEDLFKDYLRKLDVVVDATIRLNCAESVRQFWAIKPPPGLAAQAPEIAESYRRAAARVSTAYGLLMGTILTYPRDTQPLTLVDSILPRSIGQSPAWSLHAVESGLVVESVVLPDLFKRGMQHISDVLQVDPENDIISELLVAPSSEALEVVLPLLRNKRLNHEGRSVSVTTLGTMAWVSTAEKPDLSRDALKLLANLTSSEKTEFWPDKDENVKGAAVTALHLSRNPYAGYLLGQQLKAKDLNACAKMTAGIRPISCIGQTPTAAGYLLQDLAAEARRFSSSEQVPQSLQTARLALESFMAESIISDKIPEEVRGAACTAVGIGGGINIPTPEMREAFLKLLTLEHLKDHPFSAGACLLNSHRTGVEIEKLRPILRRIVLTQSVPGHTRGDSDRVRFAALHTLYNIGLSGELETLSKVYLNEPADSRIFEYVRNRLEDVNATAITIFLRECARDEKRQESERVRCLDGFSHTHSSIDGDDSSANDVIAIAAEGPQALRTAACGAIGIFWKRNGRIVMRLKNSGDPTVTACLAQLDKAPDDKDGTNELLEQLRRLLQPSPTDAKPSGT